MDDATQPPAKPAPVSPMAFFKDTQVVRHHRIYKYEQDTDVTWQKARQLRELQAYVEWEEYCGDAIAPLLWSILDPEAPDMAAGFQSAIAGWPSWNEQEKLEFLKYLLDHIASLFGVAAPAITTYDKWLASLDADHAHIYNPTMYAIYYSSNRLIVINQPDILKTAPIWLCIPLMAHEFSHHLIRVKAEELFEDLQENINHHEFRKNHPHDRSRIAQHPLCAVISTCEEFRLCADYRAVYEEQYINNTDSPESHEFIEEALAHSFEDLYSCNLREALLLNKMGYTAPCAKAYAQLVISALTDVHKNLVTLSSRLGETYAHPQLNSLPASSDPVQAYHENSVLIAALFSDFYDQVWSLKTDDQSLMYQISELREFIAFLQFCTGRFEAYDENERNSENRE